MYALHYTIALQYSRWAVLHPHTAAQRRLCPPPVWATPALCGGVWATPPRVLAFPVARAACPIRAGAVRGLHRRRRTRVGGVRVRAPVSIGEPATSCDCNGQLALWPRCWRSARNCAVRSKLALRCARKLAFAFAFGSGKLAPVPQLCGGKFALAIRIYTAPFPN